MHTIYFRDWNGYWGPNSKEPNFWYINSISWVSLFNDVFEPTLDKQEVEFDSAAPQLVAFIWPFIAGSVLPFTTYSSSCLSHLWGTNYHCLIRIYNNSAISLNFDNAEFFQNHDNSVNSDYSICDNTVQYNTSLVYVAGISLVYLKYIADISQVYLEKSKIYLRCISGRFDLPQVYLRHFSDISWVYLKYIQGV